MLILRNDRSSGFDSNYVVIPPELRTKYPAPPGYEWQDETSEDVAALKHSTIRQEFELILRHDLVEVLESGKLKRIKTEGLEDSVRLLWSRVLFGKE